MAEGKTSGSLVVEANEISKTFGDRTIVKDFSIRIMRKDRIGVVGANGAGKTTLIKMLTGALEVDSGTVKIGASVQMASLDQRRTSLHPQTTLSEALTGGGSDFVEINGERKHVIGYMKDFLFTPEQSRTPVSRLSGGERGRLTLARALALPSNFLVLDEPTNDLDLETLDLLQEMLTDYPGTLLIVSHDRDFLDRVATSIIVSEDDGAWAEYAGGYSDMVSQRGRGVGARAILPPPPAPKAEKSAAVASDQPKKKMSFKQKHALETLPKQMDLYRATMAKLQDVLADSNLYARNPDAFEKATKDYAKAEKSLAKAEEEWFDLEMLREELEG